MSVQERIFGRLGHFLCRSRRTLFLITIAVAIIVIFIALIAVRRAPSVKAGIEAYGEGVKFTNGVISIDCGEINVGSSHEVAFNLRNVSNESFTLAFGLANWKPRSIEPFILVSGNYTGTRIAPGEEIPIAISLNVSSSADFVDYLIANQVASFRFSLSIQAVES